MSITIALTDAGAVQLRGKRRPAQENQQSDSSTAMKTQLSQTPVVEVPR